MMQSPLERRVAAAQLCVLCKATSQACCGSVMQFGGDGYSLQVRQLDLCISSLGSQSSRSILQVPLQTLQLGLPAEFLLVLQVCS